MAAYNRRQTAGEIVKRMLGEQGLVVPSSVYGNSDQLTTQLSYLLNRLGQELLDEPGGWQFFNKTFTIVTVPGTLTYNLPTDFEGFIDESGWNRTSRLPLIGPLDEQQWQLLQARQLGGLNVGLQYLIRADKVEFYSLPAVAQTLAFSYKGRGWVRDAADATIYKDLIEVDGDTPMYDPVLLIAGLLFKWKDRKGFDANVAKFEYDTAKSAALNKDIPGKDVNLDSGNSAFPYLGFSNLPATGYGP